MVVHEGDHVQVTFVNGGSKAMNVGCGHSLDLHAAAVPPGRDFATLEPGKTVRFGFVASHAGTFLYHCATAPMIEHLGSGWTALEIRAFFVAARRIGQASDGAKSAGVPNGSA